MKTKLISLLAIIMLSALKLNSQNAFRDAIALEKYIENGKIKRDSASLYNVCNILVNYINNPGSTSKANVLGAFYKQDASTNKSFNPIIGPYVNIGDGDTDFDVQKAISPVLKSLGNVDVTNFSDALARFLIKRGEEELNVAFFSRLQKFIEDNSEARILFPKTSNILRKIEISRYAELIQTIRKAFDDDLKAIPSNAYKLLNEEKYAELNKQFPELGIVLRTANTLSKTNPSKNPVSFVNDLTLYPEWMLLDTNIASSFKTLNIISNSLVDESGKSWVSMSDLQGLYKNKVAFNIYIGLLHAKAEGIEFKYNGTVYPLRTFLASVGTNEGQIKNLLDNFTSMTDQLKELQNNIKENNGELNNDIIYTYLNKTIEIATYGSTIANTIKPNLINTKYLEYTNKGIEIYKYTYTKEYASAIFTLYSLLQQITNDPKFDSVKNTLTAQLKKEEDLLATSTKKYKTNYPANSPKSPDTDLPKLALEKEIETATARVNSLTAEHKLTLNLPKFSEKFLTFGNFIAGMAKAETPEEMEQVIEASALPAGSSRVKKHTTWSTDINAYVGYYYGAARKSSNGAFSINQGITAPVGFTLNRGLGQVGSISLFASIIDVGAVVDYRLNNDSSAIDQQIHLENILSPGVSLTYGLFCNLPISISWGYQYGPNMLKVESNLLTLQTKPAWRWFVSATVDIPLVQLSAQRTIKKHIKD